MIDQATQDRVVRWAEIQYAKRDLADLDRIRETEPAGSPLLDIPFPRKQLRDRVEGLDALCWRAMKLRNQHLELWQTKHRFYSQDPTIDQQINSLLEQLGDIQEQIWTAMGREYWDEDSAVACDGGSGCDCPSDGNGWTVDSRGRWYR